MRKVGLLLLTLLALSCIPAATEAQPQASTPTSPTWARTEAIGVVHTWLSQISPREGRASCLAFYSHHAWTAELVNDGMWLVEATPTRGDRTGAWYVYEATVSIGRSNENVSGC